MGCCTAAAAIGAVINVIQKHIALRRADRNVVVDTQQYLADLGAMTGLQRPLKASSLAFACSLCATDYMGTQRHPSSHCGGKVYRLLLDHPLEFERYVLWHHSGSTPNHTDI
jgi:hypothetical protein